MTILRAAALLAAMIAVYWPSLAGSPLWDDAAHLTRPEMQGLDGLWAIWTRVGATQQYYPLTHSAFWLQHHTWGSWWPGYHLTSLVLHWASALLLVAVVQRLRVRGAWLAGALFALHPVMVESVAWMTELKNTLSGALFLAAALAYLREGPRRWPYAAALGLFAAALAAKSVTAVLPAALLVVAWWRHGRLGWRRDVAPLLPFFVVGAAAGALTTWVEHRYIGARGAEFALGAVERCLVAGRAFWFYLGKLAWPADLAFVYPRWRIDAGAAWQYGPPLAAGALIVGLWLLRRRSRAPLALALYFAAALGPALGFVNVYPHRYSFVADHWAYLASIGPLVVLAAVLARLRARAVAGLCLALLAVLTWRQAGHYTDAETLYRRTLEANPACWMARQNLGVLLYERGALVDAEAQLLAALEGHPAPAGVHSSLGLVAMSSDDAAGAERRFRRAVAIDPDLADAHNNLGVLLVNTSRRDEAESAWSAALNARPDHAQASANLARLRSHP
jgi:protein O-mannosyl-transferase